MIDASKVYLKTGDFYNVKITDAADIDLYGEALNVNNVPPVRKEIHLKKI